MQLINMNSPDHSWFPIPEQMEYRHLCPVYTPMQTFDIPKAKELLLDSHPDFKKWWGGRMDFIFYFWAIQWQKSA